MRRAFPAQQVRAAAEKTLQEHGYRVPYEYLNEARVLVGAEPQSFVYCLQYKIQRTASKILYVVMLVDTAPATDDLEGYLLYKRANLEFTLSELLFSLYR